MYILNIIIIVVIFLIIFNKNIKYEHFNFIKGVAVSFQHKENDKKKNIVIDDANNKQSMLKKYFNNISINPVSYNKSIIYPKIYPKIIPVNRTIVISRWLIISLP